MAFVDNSPAPSKGGGGAFSTPVPDDDDDDDAARRREGRRFIDLGIFGHLDENTEYFIDRRRPAWLRDGAEATPSCKSAKPRGRASAGSSARSAGARDSGDYSALIELLFVDPVRECVAGFMGLVHLADAQVRSDSEDLPAFIFERP